MRLLAKNAPAGQLVRWGWAMALYDLAYVAFVAADGADPRPPARRAWRACASGATIAAPAPRLAARSPWRRRPGRSERWRQRAAYRKGAG